MTFSSGKKMKEMRNGPPNEERKVSFRLENEGKMRHHLSGTTGSALDTSSEADVGTQARKRRWQETDATGEDDTFATNTKPRSAPVGGEEKVDSIYSLLAESKETDNAGLRSSKAIPVEAFNLDEERASGDGYFDGDTYVFRSSSRKRDDDEGDAWLDSLKETCPPQKTQSAPRHTDEQGDSQEESSDDDTSVSSESKATSAQVKKSILQQLVTLMASPTETVSGAMRRLGRITKNNTKSFGNVEMAKFNLQKLTTLTNTILLQYKDHDIYQKTRSDLEEEAGSILVNSGGSSKTDESSDDAKPELLWEYVGQTDQQVHGPYTTKEMLTWIAQGFFVGDSAVKVRSFQIAASKKKEKASAETDVQAMIADLDDSDDDEEEEGNRTSVTQEDRIDLPKSAWMLSDEVDFKSYLI